MCPRFGGLLSFYNHCHLGSGLVPTQASSKHCFGSLDLRRGQRAGHPGCLVLESRSLLVYPTLENGPEVVCTCEQQSRRCLRPVTRPGCCVSNGQMDWGFPVFFVLSLLMCPRALPRH